MKTYHQHASNLNESDQIVQFIFDENDNYHQIGNAYRQHGMRIEKDVDNAEDRFLVDGFKEARLSNTGGSDIQHNKNVGQISTFMRVLTSEDGDLLSHFHKIDESRDEIGNSSLHPHLINNYDLAANRGKNKGHLPLEHVFGFW